MARVSRLVAGLVGSPARALRDSRDDRSGRGDDRGQVLLVGAFAIALLIVALATVLNGAVFTETLATSDGTGDARDALTFERDAAAGVGEVIAAVNHDGLHATDADAKAALDAAVADWEDAAAASAALDGATGELNVTSVTYGSRLTQLDASRDFTDATGADNWTLAAGVTDSRAVQLNVTRASLANQAATEQFTVLASEGNDTWQVSFSGNNTTVFATVTDLNGTVTTCSAAGDHVVADLSAGTLGGEPCPALAVPESSFGTYDLALDGATLVTGTFDLVVDVAVPDDGRYDSSTGPTVSSAVYSVDLDVSYASARVTYGTTVDDVRPGDADA